MPERIVDRCIRICGSSERKCFRDNKKHLFCISDMVINKAFGIEAMLGAIRQSPHSYEIEDMLAMTEKDISELISWAKFLQSERKPAEDPITA